MSNLLILLAALFIVYFYYLYFKYLSLCESIKDTSIYLRKQNFVIVELRGKYKVDDGFLLKNQEICFPRNREKNNLASLLNNITRY
jgi:hypothetical protein